MEDQGAPINWDFWNTALTFGESPQNDHERTFETVPMNALQSMQPMADAADVGDSWTGLFKDVFKGVIGYAIAKDAADNNVPQPGQAVTPTYTPNLNAQYLAQVGQAAQQGRRDQAMMWMGLGLGALVLVSVARG